MTEIWQLINSQHLNLKFRLVSLAGIRERQQSGRLNN